MDTTDARVRSGSQSKIPAILFWLVAAAVLLRSVTVVFDRGTNDAGSGLGRWRPQHFGEAGRH